MWKDRYGPIPDGCIVKHKDGDFYNNDIRNLVLVRKYDSEQRSRSGTLRARKWKTAHPEYYAERNERRRLARRAAKMALIEKYGGKCAICGEDHWECLSIDHVHGNGRKERREKGRNYYELLMKAPLDPGLRILCFNCNCSIGFFGYSPYEKESRNAAGSG
jgi:hypothetical protein